MIVLRSEDEISSIRRAGAIISATFDALRRFISPGITTKALDEIASREIKNRGGTPAFMGVKVGEKVYPANICTSINDIVVHGIPSERALKDGDIISVDIGVKYKDYYADAAITVGIGSISEIKQKLISVTERSLFEGIKKAVSGNRLGDVSSAIQKCVESNGFSVVRDLVGHGIGTELWEDPQVPNYGKAGSGPRLETGMVIAIEPMVNQGSFDVQTLEDGWAISTCDGKLSAHFEHTVVIREGTAEILTA